jgi:hypothetical protein
LIAELWTSAFPTGFSLKKPPFLQKFHALPAWKAEIFFINSIFAVDKAMILVENFTIKAN